MKLLPGTFESVWERRRADLLNGSASGSKPAASSEWDWRRRGNVTRLGVDARERFRAQQAAVTASSTGPDLTATSARPMRARFEALARGSQPAVVKVSSYGPGSQAGGRLNYISRDGAVELETETGDRVTGKAALAELRAEWEPLFSHRAATRDVGAFGLSIEAPVGRNDDLGTDELVRRILKSGLGERRFFYGVREVSQGRFEIEGLVMLRDRSGNRLSGDAEAASRVQDLLDLDRTAREMRAALSFHGHGNGVADATARLRRLIGRFDGAILDESGRRIATDEASMVVRTSWRKEFHSSRGRDVMHLIMSARAGTDMVNFTNAVREFLGEQFAEHRYAFAIHDPAKDPKRTAEGGRRPHIHAHAIVTMRPQTGKSLDPYIGDYRRWRMALADKARRNGIAMEATDRRERASPPAFTRNQVRPVSYDGATAYIGTSTAGQSRYDEKRADVAVIGGSSATMMYAQRAYEVWQAIAAEAADPQAARHARNQADRIAEALRENAPAKTAREELGMEEADRGEEPMRQMTRQDFDAYEKRIEAVLRDIDGSLGPGDRAGFEEIAAAARDVVDSRRGDLQLGLRQEGVRSVEAPASRAQAGRSGHAGEPLLALDQQPGETAGPAAAAGRFPRQTAEPTFRPSPPRPWREEHHEQRELAQHQTGREERER